MSVRTAAFPGVAAGLPFAASRHRRVRQRDHGEQRHRGRAKGYRDGLCRAQPVGGAEIKPYQPFGKSLRIAISAASPGDSTFWSKAGCGAVTMSYREMPFKGLASNSRMQSARVPL